MLLKSSDTLTEIVGRKGASKFDSLMNQIYENPVETEVGLIARILAVCVKIKKLRPGTFAPESSGHCASLLVLQ